MNWKPHSCDLFVHRNRSQRPRLYLGNALKKTAFSLFSATITRSEYCFSLGGELTRILLPGDCFYADRLCKQNSQDDDIMPRGKREASLHAFPVIIIFRQRSSQTTWWNSHLRGWERTETWITEESRGCWVQC